MTRSRRVRRNRLKRKDPEFIGRFDRWQAEAAPGPIPWECVDLFQKRSFAHLATLMGDGTPHLTPVWVDFDGRHMLINSAAGLDRLARRYLGLDRYPPSWRFPGEVRRIYRIAPKRVTTWDPF